VPLLQIEDLRTHIQLKHGVVRAVDGVTLHVEQGETLGVVGESGCGKTMTALSIMNLLPGGGHIVSGSILLGGRDLTKLDAEAMRKVRGDEVGMIFQDPLSSLNPTHTVGDQIAEAVLLHRDVTKQEAWERAIEVLDLVGLPRARERAGEFPHQFSGGMRQRVMIAMALACEPKLLIADEPTTALDVTIQKQILELIDSLRLRLGMSVILVTHDLGVIAGRADQERAGHGLLLGTDREEAGVGVRGRLAGQHRVLRPATVGDVPAAGREPAALRRVDQVRRRAGDGVQPVPGLR